MDEILKDEKIVDNATKKEKEVDKHKKSRREGKKEKSLSKPPTKIVIRNLPPTMTELEFLQQTDPLPEHDFYYYCLADWSLGLEATCRAYITLKDQDNVFLFRDRFDGYVFVDTSGIEYVAIVEYAPFQGFSKKKSRSNDNKENTIELEPHYNQYLECLLKEREDCTRSGGDLKNDFTLDRKVDDKMTSTPLLQYLASKKEKRREEAKKRNEEKKKLREDEKLKQLQLRTVKSTQSQHGENKTQKSTKEKDVTGQQKDKKNSRSKRRAERDQRRREEHEQRKKARDFQNDVQQTEKSESGNQKADQDEKQKNSKSKSGKEIKLLRKTDLNESTETQKQTCQNETTSKKNITLNNVPNIDKEQVSETVLNFIRNAAAMTETSKCDTTNQFPINKPKLESQYSSEERRIRNKDRPSIAIYQPKARVHHSEEKEDFKDQDNAIDYKIEKKSRSNSSRRDRRSKQKLDAEMNRRFDHRLKSKTSDEDGKSSPQHVSDDKNDS